MKKQSNSPTTETVPSRRSFLTKLWIVLGFVALAEFIAVGVAFLRPGKSKASQDSADTVIIGGAVDKFLPNSVTAFDITGKVISAPAPRALDIYPVIIENNIVKVDTGKPIKRSEFSSEQVVYPRKLSDRITGKTG